jgi:hypothetical protein
MSKVDAAGKATCGDRRQQGCAKRAPSRLLGGGRPSVVVGLLTLGLDLLDFSGQARVDPAVLDERAAKLVPRSSMGAGRGVLLAERGSGSVQHRVVGGAQRSRGILLDSHLGRREASPCRLQKLARAGAHAYTANWTLSRSISAMKNDLISRRWANQPGV